MTSQNAQRDDFDRLMSQWMEADGRVREPEQLLESVLERTRVARRIPGWLLPERWIPVQLTMPLRAAPRLAPVLLLIALRPRRRRRDRVVGSQPRLPDPFGLAANGRVAYVSNGQIYAADPDGSELGPADVRHPNGVHARVVARRDQGRVQADRPAISGGGPDAVRRSRRRQRRRFQPHHDRTRRQGDEPARRGRPTVGWSCTRIWSATSTRSSSPPPTARAHRGVWVTPTPSTGLRCSPRTAARSSTSWTTDRVAVMNTDGTDDRTLNSSAFTEIHSANWHPDGRQVVVSAATTGNIRLLDPVA